MSRAMERRCSASLSFKSDATSAGSVVLVTTSFSAPAASARNPFCFFPPTNSDSRFVQSSQA
eukprot:3021940-Alexandrium_andersonii.AAC.1